MSIHNLFLCKYENNICPDSSESFCNLEVCMAHIEVRVEYLMIILG